LQGRPERSGPLLGFETSVASPPCAISVPNLIADRGVWVTVAARRLNVRRLMYQSLIWRPVLRDEARGLSAPFNPKDRKRLPNSLIDRMRGDMELGSNFLGRKMLIDK
jgi:hypothetical protein